ncbi:hypothetical protein [Bacteroides stercoris]|uniref:hypothetical protein n=1 Tax=Bacteroides stercoris TaxID=46506 RepID=UPI00189A036D|nr:hypothetical protein [Bacteroides stercoris]
MERKNISLSYGIHRSPSIGADGELSECVNLIPKNGELTSVLPPKDTGIMLDEGELLLFVHNTSKYKNYIYAVGNTIKAFRITDGEREDFPFAHALENDESISHMQSIGNTLIGITNKSLQYFLFKDNTYRYLGNKGPELDMSFGLHGYLYESEEITVDISKNFLPEPADNPLFNMFTFPVEAQQQISEQLSPKINEFINYIKSFGNFTESFFVRYAYRTINGYYTQSTPILMTPNSGRFPYLPCSTQRYEGNILKEVKTRITAYVGRLDYRVDKEAIDVLRQWSDIIQSVDIFISEPVSYYVQDSRNYVYKKPSSFGSIEFIGARGGILSVGGTDADKIYARTGNLSKNTDFELGAPALSESDYNELVKRVSVFRKVRSISLDELKAYDDIEIDAEILQNLNVQEALPDDYNSHEKIKCNFSFIYNSRLNIAGINRYPYAFPPKAVVNYTNGEKSGNETVRKTYSYKITVLIRDTGSITAITSAASTLNNLGEWIYYPNPNAYRMIIEKTDSAGGTLYADLQLTKHEFLNGAYYYNTGMDFTGKKPEIPTDATDYIHEPNKIYTSEVGNPFFFPLSGINTVGTGNILGISSATKALSQGQFGQFPLYAFSTDGIWAMEVNPETGLYSSVQPVSRDVCNNPASITQIDAAIVFTTDRGLKLLQGSDVVLLSSSMEGHNTDEGIFNISDEFSPLFVNDTEQFVEMLRSCLIAYDYAHSMLHIFPNDEAQKHYIFSLESNEFASYVGYNIRTVINNYPQTIVQSGNKVLSYDNYVSEDIYKGVAVTRELAFDDPFCMKIIHDLRVMSYRTKEKSRIRIAIFVSNDGQKWFQLHSLRQHSFRFYRIAFFTEMSDTDTLSGVSMMFDYRRNNKLR